MQKERFVPIGIQEINGKEYIGICVDENWIAEVMRDSFTGTFVLCEGNTVCNWGITGNLTPYSYKSNALAMDCTALLQVAHAYHDSFLTTEKENVMEQNKESKEPQTVNSFRGDYSFLSNFYHAPVEYDGITYQSNEAAFQAQKCANEKDKEKFATLSPGDAKRLGRQVALRPDWEDVKVDIMRDIVMEKFNQNPDLRDKLMDLEGVYLEEGNTWGDRVWGTVNGNGANLLGKILMEVRDEYIRQEKEYEDKGYAIVDFDNTGMLEVQKIDAAHKFASDEEAVEQAIKDGVKFIPVEELPDNFDRMYLGWVDTPENRKRIEQFAKEHCSPEPFDDMERD